MKNTFVTNDEHPITRHRAFRVLPKNGESVMLPGMEDGWKHNGNHTMTGERMNQRICGKGHTRSTEPALISMMRTLPLHNSSFG